MEDHRSGHCLQHTILKLCSHLLPRGIVQCNGWMEGLGTTPVVAQVLQGTRTRGPAGGWCQYQYGLPPQMRLCGGWPLQRSSMQLCMIRGPALG